MQDSIIQMFPWKYFASESLRSGVIPLWNPYQMLGLPFLASMKPMIFYPLTWLMMLDNVKGWNFIVFSQVFCSMLFMFFLLRHWKVHVLGAVMGAVAWGFNSFMMAVLEFGSEGHVLLWVPLILLGVDHILLHASGIWILISAFSVALMLFAGHLQFASYGLISVFGYMVVRFWMHRFRMRNLIAVVVTFVLGFGIASVQLIPSIEQFLSSSRNELGGSQFTSGLIDPSTMLRLVAPDLYGNPIKGDDTIGYIEDAGYIGIIPLFFALYAFVFYETNAVLLFLRFLIVISALFSLRGIGEILLAYHIPIITSGSGGRIFSMVLLGFSLLTGFGVDRFLKQDATSQKTKIKYVAIFFLSILSLFLFILCISKFYVRGTLPASYAYSSLLRNLKFPFLIIFCSVIPITLLLFIKRTKARQFILLICVGLSFIDLFRLGYRFITFSNPKFLYPKTASIQFLQEQTKNSLGRFVGLLEPELSTVFHLYSLETYNPFFQNRTAKLMNALQDLPTDSLPVNKYYLTRGIPDLKYTMDVLGVEYISALKGSNPSYDLYGEYKYQTSLNKVYEDDKHTIYRNAGAYPRFGLFYKASIIPNSDNILTAIRKRKVNLKDTLILEEAPPVSLTIGTGSAILVRSTDNFMKFHVKTSADALFYISDAFDPGWKAMMDSKEAKVYRANYDLRAIFVPSGEHVIDYTYQPTSFRVGLIISFSSSIGLIILVYLYSHIEKKNKKSGRNTSFR